MQQQPTCDVCGDPTDGYVCRRCTDRTARHLREVVDLAGEVETTVTRQCRYATRGGRQLQEVDADPAAKADGALRSSPLPVDLHASARAAAAFVTVTTWARHVVSERGLEPAPLLTGQHPAAGAAAFLLDQVDWLRHQPCAAEALEELAAAGAAIRRVVDAPPEQVVVGVCDCGAHLYARQGAQTVVCPDCKASWDVQTSRQSLLDALRDRLVTAAEGATLAVLVFPDERRDKLRDAIRTWAGRGHLTVAVGTDGPMYPFGEIIERVTRHVAARSGQRRATVTA